MEGKIISTVKVPLEESEKLTYFLFFVPRRYFVFYSFLYILASSLLLVGNILCMVSFIWALSTQDGCQPTRGLYSLLITLTALIVLVEIVEFINQARTMGGSYFIACTFYFTINLGLQTFVLVCCRCVKWDGEAEIFYKATVNNLWAMAERDAHLHFPKYNQQTATLFRKLMSEWGFKTKEEVDKEKRHDDEIKNKDEMQKEKEQAAKDADLNLLKYYEKKFVFFTHMQDIWSTKGGKEIFLTFAADTAKADDKDTDITDIYDKALKTFAESIETKFSDMALLYSTMVELDVWEENSFDVLTIFQLLISQIEVDNAEEGKKIRNAIIKLSGLENPDYFAIYNAVLNFDWADDYVDPDEKPEEQVTEKTNDELYKMIIELKEAKENQFKMLAEKLGIAIPEPGVQHEASLAKFPTHKPSEALNAKHGQSMHSLNIIDEPKSKSKSSVQQEEDKSEEL